MTTHLDALFLYGQHPQEASMAAIGKVRDVYGIRRIQVNERDKTIRVEFDFTRLDRAAVAQLLRRAGIDVVSELSLIPPQQPSPVLADAAPPPAK